MNFVTNNKNCRSPAKPENLHWHLACKWSCASAGLLNLDNAPQLLGIIFRLVQSFSRGILCHNPFILQGEYYNTEEMSEMVEAEVRAQEKRENQQKVDIDRDEPVFDNILEDKVQYILAAVFPK